MGEKSFLCPTVQRVAPAESIRQLIMVYSRLISPEVIQTAKIQIKHSRGGNRFFVPHCVKGGIHGEQCSAAEKYNESWSIQESPTQN